MAKAPKPSAQDRVNVDRLKHAYPVFTHDHKI